MKWNKTCIYRSIVILGIVLLTGCGGGSNDNNTDTTNHWDKLVWDQGNWQ